MTFVLVHGGWHGGWCWAGVAHRLHAQGQAVYAPSLTGLGERRHLIEAVKGPDTHVADIVNLIDAYELDRVVLVGHSYGGMIITGVASTIPERLTSLVYVDAFVPTKSGQSASAMANPERAAEVMASIKPDGTIPPSGFKRWSEDPQVIAWLKQKCTPHPASCFGKGVTLTGRQNNIASKTFVLCEKHQPSPFWQFHDRYRDDPSWSVHRLNCLHDAMIDKPEELTDILLASMV